MFAERLELIKGRKQFHTAPHLKFDKFHHNKRIALKLQSCVLGSLIYLPHRLFFLMGSRSYFKPSNTPPKNKTHLSWYTFEVHTLIFASCISTTKLPSAGERLLVRLSTSKRRHCGVQRGQFNRKYRTISNAREI